MPRLPGFPRLEDPLLYHRARLAAGLAAASLAVTGLSGAVALAGAGPASASSATGTAALTASDYHRACPVTSRPGQMSCMALVRRAAVAGAVAGPGAAAPDGPPAGFGYGPASLQSAYKLPSATAGAGRTVAVVDAYDDPSAAADLATYRSDWGLPACGTGCFTKVNENGQASPLPAAAGTSGWATEESLDLDMVSAICPNCHILLVEASSTSITDLGTAVNSAVRLGADYVSNSYGGSESSSDPTFDADYYRHPGVAVTASAGDDGYGVSYPASSQYVTSVGGTTLTTAGGARGWTETVWGSAAGGEGTGSGCSADEAKPSWQKDTGCARRTDNDVAADANPNTGVAVYDTYGGESGWLEVGGTSASSPIIASVYALAGTPAAGTYPASYLYQHASSLFDVTSGADGTCAPAYLCTAEAGYDGPTGLGTPDGTAAFTSGGGGICTPAQLLGNPGFETGQIAPWTSTPEVLAASGPGDPAHSGSWLAWLDGYESAHTDTLAQTVTIPAGCTAATLSFWLDIVSSDPNQANGTLTVQVKGTSGTTTLATYATLHAAGGYAQHSFSLTPWIGQKVTITFTGRQTVSGQVASFYEDDNGLNVP
jgi:hypothetical protein